MRVGLAEALKSNGVILRSDAVLECITDKEGTKQIGLSDLTVLEVDLVLIATGRTAKAAGLDPNAAGVQVSATGEVLVNEHLATSVPHIYAIGDVTDRLNLTPVATGEGNALADRRFGSIPRKTSLENVPTAVFSIPPIGTVGLTKSEAALRGPGNIFVTKFTPERHQITGCNRYTIVKLVVDATNDRVLRAHMIGEDAPEIVQGLVIAIRANTTKGEFDRTFGIHPTAAEEFVTLRTPTRVSNAAYLEKI